jgi:N6-L-threonylcarbamoyladenine synthase
MLNRPGHDFSFSGLKTAVMIEVRKAAEREDLDRCRADIAASFQRAAVDTLVKKAVRAANSASLSRIVVAGGVGANKLLRREISDSFPGEVYYPRMAWCTDNGAMIAVAGALRLADARPIGEIRVQARWPLDSLTAPVRAD